MMEGGNRVFMNNKTRIIKKKKKNLYASSYSSSFSTIPLFVKGWRSVPPPPTNCIFRYYLCCLVYEIREFY